MCACLNVCVVICGSLFWASKQRQDEMKMHPDAAGKLKERREYVICASLSVYVVICRCLF
jgi:hypothetical protein